MPADKKDTSCPTFVRRRCQPIRVSLGHEPPVLSTGRPRSSRRRLHRRTLARGSTMRPLAHKASGRFVARGRSQHRTPLTRNRLAPHWVLPRAASSSGCILGACLTRLHTILLLEACCVHGVRIRSAVARLARRATNILVCPSLSMFPSGDAFHTPRAILPAIARER